MEPARRAAVQRAALPFHVLAKPFGAGCNLRCAYCFYLEKRELFAPGTPARMQDDVLEAFTRAYIEAQPDGATEVEFAWQGGEPTLSGLDFFRRALELQEKHARAGLAVRNSLQTNGTLLDEAWARFLAENEFLVGLSLDGPRTLHDAWRIDTHGGPTFERVMMGLSALQQQRVEINTLTVVHHANADHPREVYDFLFDAGVRHMQFIPLVEPGPAGGVNARSVAPAGWGRFLSGVFDRWLEREHVGQVFVRDFESLLGLSLGLPASHCAAASQCGRCLAIERTGDVYACDHFVDGAHHLGNVLRRSLAAMADGAKQSCFGLDKAARLPRACRECVHLRLCGGGCPKDRLVPDRYGEPGLNYLCAGFVAFFEHALPTLRRMGACLRRGWPASDYARMA